MSNFSALAGWKAPRGRSCCFRKLNSRAFRLRYPSDGAEERWQTASSRGLNCFAFDNTLWHTWSSSILKVSVMAGRVQMDDDNESSSDLELPLSQDRGNEQETLIKSPSNQVTPRYVYFLTAFAAIGGFLFGYDTGVISGAMILIKQEFQLSYFWQELVVSVTIGTAILGALLGGFLNQWLGRKPILIVSATVFTVGAIVMGVAHSKEVLLLGRFIVGFGIGELGLTLCFFHCCAMCLWVFLFYFLFYCFFPHVIDNVNYLDQWHYSACRAVWAIISHVFFCVWVLSLQGFRAHSRGLQIFSLKKLTKYGTFRKSFQRCWPNIKFRFHFS